MPGVIWDHGPGCTNLALNIEGSNSQVEKAVGSITLALQPAKWSECLDDIPDGYICRLFE